MTAWGEEVAAVNGYNLYSTLDRLLSVSAYSIIVGNLPKASTVRKKTSSGLSGGETGVREGSMACPFASLS